MCVKEIDKKKRVKNFKNEAINTLFCLSVEKLPFEWVELLLKMIKEMEKDKKEVEGEL